VEAVLCSPGDLENVVGLAGLAVAEGDADTRLAQVVPGGLDHDAAGAAGAGLGDRPARSLSPDWCSEGTSPSQAASWPGVGFANSGGLVFVDESAEQIASA
jgi:hypothetical protein